METPKRIILLESYRIRGNDDLNILGDTSCNRNFFIFSAFSEIDCHILFTITCHGTFFDIEIVMRMILLKNVIL